MWQRGWDKLVIRLYQFLKVEVSRCLGLDTGDDALRFCSGLRSDQKVCRLSEIDAHAGYCKDVCSVPIIMAKARS